MKTTDLTVESANPEALDNLVQQLGPAALVWGSQDAERGTCKIRVFGDPGYIKFALETQGYAKVLGEEEVSVNIPGERES